MALEDYLRDEIDEEASYGIIAFDERDRRLALLEAAVNDSGGSVRSGSLGAVLPAMASIDHAVTVGEDDDALHSQTITVHSQGVEVRAYLAVPTGGIAAPAIVVIHENKGLVPYIRDVARRLAKAGYVALSPDLVSRAGGTDSFADEAEVIAALGKLGPDELVADLRACVSELAGRQDVRSDRLGAIGFCFGGGMVWRLATKDSRIRAAVPFYGRNPPLEDVGEINAAVLAVYGGEDARINAGIGEIESAMQQHGKIFEKAVLPGAGHAFHNDTNPARYHQNAAHEAWSTATNWFQRWLRDG
jgi:carboxymethylenebutenolidase